MTGIGPSLKSCLPFWPATVLSIAVHCLIGTLFLFCLEAIVKNPPALNVINVEIREPAPLREIKADVPEPRKALPKVIRRQLTAKPAVPYQAPLARPEKLQSPQPPLAPSPAVVTKEINSLSRRGSEISANSLSIQAARDKSSAGMMSPVGMGPTTRVADSPGMDVDIVYLATLRGLIERGKEYPAMARKGRMEGAVRVSCIISRNGELRETKVISSSGYAILDNAALRAVRSAGRFPSVPSRIKDDPFCFIAPITFRLSAE